MVYLPLVWAGWGILNGSSRRASAVWDCTGRNRWDACAVEQTGSLQLPPAVQWPLQFHPEGAVARCKHAHTNTFRKKHLAWLVDGESCVHGVSRTEQAAHVWTVLKQMPHRRHTFTYKWLVYCSIMISLYWELRAKSMSCSNMKCFCAQNRKYSRSGRNSVLTTTQPKHCISPLLYFHIYFGAKK